MSPRPSPRPLVVALALAFGLPACATSLRVGGGLDVDTAGRVAFTLRAAAGFGFAITHRRNAIMEVLEAEAGAQANPGALALAPTLGLDYHHVLESREIALRAGFRSGGAFAIADPVDARFRSGLAIAMLKVLDGEGDSFQSLGGEARGFLLFPTEDERQRGLPLRGQLGFAAVYQVDSLTGFDQFMDDLLPGKH